MLVNFHPNYTVPVTEWKAGGDSPEHLGRTTVDINYRATKWSRLVFLSFSSLFLFFFFFFLVPSTPAANYISEVHTFRGGGIYFFFLFAG